MFIELVDALRCPNAHEESWLVASANVVEARHIRVGTLGCPVCAAEYPIRDGIVDFRREPVPGASDSVLSPPTVPLPPADHLAAMMNLSDALGFVVLVGRWCAMADALLALDGRPPLLLVDPPAGLVVRTGLSGLLSAGSLPLAAGAARAVAVDTAAPNRLRSAAESIRVGGRLVAPAGATLPFGVRELARDASLWVAEREASASAPVTLHVRRAGGRAPFEP